MLPRYVIITAGGSGLRMKASVPKQFMLLKGKPVMMHTIEAFTGLSNSQPVIIVVLPASQINTWKELCQQYRFDHPLHIAEGGPTRFHSVKSGLALVPDKAVVAIHDAVRPLVSREVISQAFHYAEKLGNAIPAASIHDSVRWVENAANSPVDRNNLRIIQTPQCFVASRIKKAYQVNYEESFTDDAAVLEKNGQRIYLTEGNRENIKITTPEDLVMAEALLSLKSKQHQ